MHDYGDVTDNADEKKIEERKSTLQAIVGVARPALEMAAKLNSNIGENELLEALRAEFRGIKAAKHERVCA